MSYWISLSDENGICEVENHTEGGTIVVGGTTDADLNVTYNYSRFFSFRDLHGKTAEETIPTLEKAVEELGTERDENYWASTPGNAGYTCSILLAWAKQHPTATWDVD